jgi:hypothetical protein
VRTHEQRSAAEQAAREKERWPTVGQSEIEWLAAHEQRVPADNYTQNIRTD